MLRQSCDYQSTSTTQYSTFLSETPKLAFSIAWKSLIQRSMPQFYFVISTLSFSFTITFLFLVLQKRKIKNPDSFIYSFFMSDQLQNAELTVIYSSAYSPASFSLDRNIRLWSQDLNICARFQISEPPLLTL